MVLATLDLLKIMQDLIQLAFWARSGAMLDIAEKDTSPINPPIAFGDATTSCSLSGGICAASVYQQAKTGKGQKVMASLFGQQYGMHHLY